MRIPQFIIFIVFVGFISKSYFATIDDLFIPEDGESICVFENITDDLTDEQCFFIGVFMGARKKSICLKQTNQRIIERFCYVETPPPENSCI